MSGDLTGLCLYITKLKSLDTFLQLRRRWYFSNQYFFPLTQNGTNITKTKPSCKVPKTCFYPFCFMSTETIWLLLSVSGHTKPKMKCVSFQFQMVYSQIIDHTRQSFKIRETKGIVLYCICFTLIL